MPAPSTETVANLLTRWRLRIDEDLDTGTNLFTDDEGLSYMNEGVREVHQTVREAHENWFVRTLRSDQGKVNIRGEAYDTTLLQVQAGRDELVLPPDFFELRLMEAIPDSGDNTVRRLGFVREDLSAPAFRTRLLLDSSDNFASMYYYDIEQRMSGAIVVLAPVPALDSSAGVIVKYVQDAPELELTSTFEDTAFTRQMVDAVLTFMVMRVREKEGNPQALGTSAAEWERKRTVALRNAGPRESRDPETVIGYLEEELY